VIGLRVLVAFACGADLVLTALLFQQVGRFFIPRYQMRALMAASMVVTGTIGLANIQHVHRSPNWFTWALAGAMIAKAAAMATLVHWYGTTEGQRHTALMLKSREEGITVPARTSLERRVDLTLLGLMAVGGIILFTLLVVGITASRTRQEEARTHAALCSFTSDLNQRIQDAKASHARTEVLIHAIHGPIFGIPHATIVTAANLQSATIQGQERTYKSLMGLHC
jgi:hypothetical protein